MTEVPGREEAPGEYPRKAPGVCVPWEEKSAEFGRLSGDPEIVKNQWEKLDVSAYMYLWWWVHR